MKLIKEILPAGRYQVGSSQGPVNRTFTTKDIRKIAETANKMLSNGLSIPAPFEHHPKALPVSETSKADSFNNGGHWTRFWVSNKNGKPALWGEAEIAGKEDDSNSPAFKALNTAKDTSICVREAFTDGKGREWRNALMHVALVSHPVVPGQPEFEKVPDDTEVVSMSMALTKEREAISPSQEDISALSTKLRQVVKLYLPENCTPETFFRDLLIAVNQFELTPPGTTDIEPVPVYMSHNLPNQPKEYDMALSQEQVDAIVKSEAVNPATGKPFTAEDFAGKSDEQRDRDSKSVGLLKAFASRLKNQTEKSIADRINRLVSSGRITKETAESVLLPKVGFEMSLDSEGEIADHPLETTLAVMESLPATKKSEPTPQDPFKGLSSPDFPLDDPSGEVPEEVKNKTIEQMLSYLKI